jgi:hypothetical protein
MATEAQIHANRANAQKSTGPRTAEGKASVSQNAVKHGLSGRLDVIKGEDQARFDQHRETLLAELRPDGVVESMLAERVVSLSWRLKRVERMHNEVFDVLLADGSTPLAKLARSLAGQRTQEDEDLLLGRAVVKDFANGRVLDRLLMYERRMENSLLKTLNDLHLRRLRVREYISRHMDEIGSPQDESLPWEDSSAKSEWSDFESSLLQTPPETPDGVTANAPGGPDADRMSATRIPQHSTIPSFQDAADDPGGRAAQEQSCKTKPIPAGTDDRQILPGEGLGESLPEDAPEETKPIWPGSQAVVDSASPAAEGGLLCENSSR